MRSRGNYFRVGTDSARSIRECQWGLDGRRVRSVSGEAGKKPIGRGVFALGSPMAIQGNVGDRGCRSIFHEEERRESASTRRWISFKGPT